VRGFSPDEVTEDEVEDAIYDKVFKACRDHALGTATSSAIANRVVLLWKGDT
jgi:hypothetical protein